MKHIRIIAAVTVALSLLFSCQKPNELGAPRISLDENIIEAGAEGASYSLKLTATTDWTLKGYDEAVQQWLTVNPVSGSGTSAARIVTLELAPNDGGERSVQLVFYASSTVQTQLYVHQAAKADDAAVTIAEFLDAKDGENESLLSGVIGGISRGSSYYGFMLKDDTGTLNCVFPANFSDYDLHTGDEVSIKGVYSYYESKGEDQMNGGTIMSHSAADVDEYESLSVADFMAKADPFTIYRLSGSVSGSVNSSYCSFNLKDDTGTVYVYSVNNADEYGKLLKSGDKVTLRGAWYEYNGASEVVDATIESYEAGTGGGNDDGGGATELVSEPVPAWMEVPAVDEAAEGLYYITHDMTLSDGSKARNFSYLYDIDAKLARWVAYPLNRTLIGAGSRTDEWGLDPKVPAEYQPSLYKSYEGDYDRGHQLPSADRLTPGANEQTFYFTNMTPQLSSLNQNAWADLESQVREWSYQMDTLFVVTGADVSGECKTGYDKEGNEVTIPNGYFKALLGYSSAAEAIGASTGGYIAIGFYYEHRSYSTPVMSQAMTIDELEKKLGYDFFPNLVAITDEETSASVENTMDGWWEANLQE